MRFYLITVFLTVGVLCYQTSDAASEPQEEPYDLLIKNGKVIDGTGNPWYYADIAIKDRRIAKVGKSLNIKAEEEIDASGLYITPGFIDVHSHAGPGLEEQSLSSAEPILAQGVTTVVINPDGGGSADIAGQQDRLEKHQLGVNVAQLVPHGTVRRKVIGSDDRAPSEDELDEMRALVKQGMEEGAFGLSSGLFYTPAAYAETEEVIELAKEAAAGKGVYSSHIRDESDYSEGLLASVEEVIEIAREAELPGIVTHIKALGTGVWGFSSPVVHRIEQARDEGVEVFADQYPYEASSTNLTAALVPSQARDGGRDAMLERLEDEDKRRQIVEGMNQNLERRGGADRIQIAEFDGDASLEGLTLDEIAEEFGEEPVEAALAMIEEANPKIVSFNMIEKDIQRFMRQEWTMTSSDGGLTEKGEGVVHPRNYGAFSRKLSRYVRDQQTVELAAAIRSMTSLPASVFGMKDRGLIRKGAVADISIFDLDEVQDNADYQDPHQLSEGMVYVLVNGGLAIENKAFTPDLHGEVLKRN